MFRETTIEAPNLPVFTGRAHRELEAGALALRQVGAQRELRHHQELAADVLAREVRLALGVVEDPQAGDLLRERLELGLAVGRGHAEEDQEAAADRGVDGAVDGHRGVADALEKGSHRTT